MLDWFMYAVFGLLFVAAVCVSLFIGRKGIKAWDLKHDQEVMLMRGLTKSDADASMIAFTGMCLPMLVLTGAAYIYFLADMSWHRYITVAIAGIVTMSPRKMWGIFQFRRVYRAVFEPTRYTYRFVVARYYRESWTPSDEWRLENRLTP